MSDKLRLWVEERAKLVTDQRALLDKVEAESRDLNADETTTYENMETRYDDLDKIITREESQIEKERAQLESCANAELPGAENEPPKREAENTPEKRNIEHTEAFGRFLRCGAPSSELRALQADSDEAGGYTVAPQQFVAELIKAVDNATVVGSLARVFSMDKAASMGFPSLDADPEDATPGGEISTADEDTQMDFGNRELIPHGSNKLIKVSEKLLRNSSLDISGIVAERLGYKFAVTKEKWYMTGNGAQQPLGLFTANDQGIGTGQDVSTGNTITAITWDGLMEAFYNLKPQYQAAATWLFNRTAIKNIRKLKDGEGNYIWENSTVVGTPSGILGAPALQSEYVPNTFTTGLYVGIVGDFKQYWIAETVNIGIKVLQELYAANFQIGYRGYQEVDAMPVLAEAFTRVTLA